MIQQLPDSAKAVEPMPGRVLWSRYAALAALGALVIGLYASSARSGWLELWSSGAENTYYNLLVRGFCAGQLNLKYEVPSGLARLIAPYDPKANSPYLLPPSRFLDLSYYQGRFYLYFGVTPALLVFWPYAALTGHYLLHRSAVVICLSAGFLVGVGLLWAVWRRYFSKSGSGALAACTLALGLAPSAPLLLVPSDVYEVAISCGCALAMVSLALLWQALHATRSRGWWLAGASLAYGLALGARPSLMFGAVILLVPLLLAWRERLMPGRQRQLWSLGLAAAGPIMVLGLGLMS
jgi:hypothetical protein